MGRLEKRVWGLGLGDIAEELVLAQKRHRNAGLHGGGFRLSLFRVDPERVDLRNISHRTITPPPLGFVIAKFWN